MIDETIFTNPNSFDYDFNDDLVKPVDMTDIYDQNLGALPNFNLFKLGKNAGVTMVSGSVNRLIYLSYQL